MEAKFVARLSKSLETHPFLDAPLEALAKKVKVHKVYLASGFLIISILLAAAFGSGELLLDFLGTIYLIISTTKARESQKSERYPFLLNSWVCFTFYKFIENLADDFLSEVPFYLLFKAAFLFWSLSPIFKGANFIYHKIVRPMVLSKAERDKRAAAAAASGETKDEDENDEDDIDAKSEGKKQD